MKPNILKTIIRGARLFTTKHSPEILLAGGIATGLYAGVLAVQATPKAIKLIEEQKRVENKEELTTLEVVNTRWKPYVPAALATAGSITMLVGANSLHVKRNTALAAACKLSEVAFTEYRDKVIETLGEKKERDIRHKIAQDKIDQNPVTKSEVYFTGNGKTLFLDLMTKRYFESDRDTIIRAANELNRRMTLGDMYCSLNDFYTEIGLDAADVGDILGWTVENLIELDFSAHMAEDGRPCIGVSFLVAPTYDYDKFM